MKVRTDFVTNSSSSSFVLQFKSEDSIEEEVHDGFPKVYSAEMMNLLLKDISEAKRLTKDDVRQIAESELYYDVVFDMREEYTNPFKDGCPKMSHREFSHWEYSGAQDFVDEVNKRMNERIDIIMSRLSDTGVIVEVEYEDHDPFGSCLEQEILPCHPNSVHRFSHH